LRKEGLQRLIAIGIVLALVLSVPVVAEGGFFSTVWDWVTWFFTGGPTAAVTFAPVVAISAVSPDTVYQGASLDLELAGSDFNSSAVVSISNPDVDILSTIIQNPNSILVNIDVSINAVPGTYDVTVTQGTQSSSVDLTVVEGPFDPSTLTNLTPSYFLTGASANLTYNITTASGVDKLDVTITGGYMEVTNTDTNTSTNLNLTNAIDPEGTFTLIFDAMTFTEDGNYVAEIYLDLYIDNEYVEREYYVYFSVCLLPPPCGGRRGFSLQHFFSVSTISGSTFIISPVWIQSVNPLRQAISAEKHDPPLTAPESQSFTCEKIL